MAPEIKAFPIVVGFGRSTGSFTGERVELFLCGSANRNRDAQCNQYGVSHIVSPRSFRDLCAEVLLARANSAGPARVADRPPSALKGLRPSDVRRRVGLANGNQRVASRAGAVSAEIACATAWNANRIGNAGGIEICAEDARMRVAHISQT